MGDNTIIELKHISKKFGDEVVLDDISLNIKDKEFITFLGPSGCGKTTMLRIIAGFLEADDGQVIFEGKDRINGRSIRSSSDTSYSRISTCMRTSRSVCAIVI